MSYARLLWALAHIHGAIFSNASITMIKAKWKKAEEDVSQPETLYKVINHQLTSVDYPRTAVTDSYSSSTP